MSEIPADILLYALIAAGLVFWLKNLLGTRHGEERDRANPFIQDPSTFKKAQSTPVQTSDDTNAPSLSLSDNAQMLDLPRNVDIDEHVWSDVSELRRHDKSFDIAQFTSAAQDAFVIVVEAFAKGDRETLSDLLAEPVMNAFSCALDEREKNGERVETEIHSIKKVEVMEARYDAPMAYMTLRFIADETAVIYDSNDNPISGDPDHITEMNDIWVFGRDLKSKDPRWLVVETRDGDVSEDHKTPMPDAS